jgi:HlyD family secretion protein
MEGQVDFARARVARETAAEKQARTMLERTKIRSPTNGTVINRSVEEGQTVAAALQSPTLFTIAQDLREMQINISVDEADIGKIAAGPVTFTVDSFPGRKFEGEVKQVRKNAKTEQNVVAYVVVASAPNLE